MPSLIGNQAFQNGRDIVCFSLGLEKIETGYKCLVVHIHTGLLAASFYLLVGTTLSLIFKKVTYSN